MYTDNINVELSVSHYFLMKIPPCVFQFDFRYISSIFLIMEGEKDHPKQKTFICGPIGTKKTTYLISYQNPCHYFPIRLYISLTVTSSKGPWRVPPNIFFLIFGAIRNVLIEFRALFCPNQMLCWSVSKAYVMSTLAQWTYCGSSKGCSAKHLTEITARGQQHV